MREYKFRGKDYNNKWRCGDLVQEKWGQGKAIMIKKDKTAWSILKETIGQYTGSKDKNGKEIYEGDIVYIAAEDERGIIRWDNETARYVVIYDNIITDFDNWYGEDLEVIGNIYDNPELLEEGE